MSAKVADLMEDLESGDRSMEHLKGGEIEDPVSLFRRVQDAFDQLGDGISSHMAGTIGGGLTGSGLAIGAGIAAQQAHMNQLANMQNQNVWMQAANAWQGYQGARSAQGG